MKSFDKLTLSEVFEGEGGGERGVTNWALEVQQFDMQQDYGMIV